MNDTPIPDELTRRAGILAEQAEELIRQLGVDVSAAERLDSGSVPLRAVADAYERLASAEKLADSQAWDHERVDGRSGQDLMRRLWDLRTDLERFEPSNNQSDA